MIRPSKEASLQQPSDGTGHCSSATTFRAARWQNTNTGSVVTDSNGTNTIKGKIGIEIEIEMVKDKEKKGNPEQ